MRTLKLLALIASTVNLLMAPQVLAQGQLSGDPTYFTGDPPTLGKVATPTSDVSWSSAVYFFTINLPPKSIQSLGQITFQQQTSPQTIQFDLKQTAAFQGTQKRREQALAIKSATLDPATQTITIVFDPPIPPGTTFTISLQAQQNPSMAGAYFFDVTAFPAGANPSPFELGMARLQFYAPFR